MAGKTKQQLERDIQKVAKSTGGGDKHGMVGRQHLIGGRAYRLVGWHQPHLLRAGDLIHVDEGNLSEVTRVEKHRGGTEQILLADGRRIVVAGEDELAVFAPT